MFTPSTTHKRYRAAGVAAIAIAAVSALAGCVSSAVTDTDLYRDYFDERRAGPGATIGYRLQEGTHVFYLTGDEREMGVLYGQKAAELDIAGAYDTIFENATTMLADDVPEEYSDYVDVPLVKRLLLDAWALMAPHTPRYIHEMLEGFAEGSGLSIDDVHAIHAIPDFTETSCSALWATEGATADGSSLQIRVLDYIMGLGIQEFPAVVFMEFNEGHTVANVGWLGLLGVISGMNDVGLGVSEMGYGNPDGENFHGTPMPFMLLDVLRYAETPQQAEGIIRATRRTNSYVYIAGSANHSGLAFVTDAYSVQTIRPGQQEAVVPQLPAMLHAGHYQERMDTLVAEHHGAISREWLQEEFIPAIAMNSNLQSVIYDLSGGRFYVADAPDDTRRAADSDFSEFSFAAVRQ